MPKGYTAAISKGMTFQEFALGCARAFGACITMRDEPNDAPIPDEFAPSTYRSDAITTATDELSKVGDMSLKECEAKAHSEYENAIAYHNTGVQDAAKLTKQYQAMMLSASNWRAPTADHVELKKFMIDQIAESMSHDCGGDYHERQLSNLKLINGESWRSQKLAKLHEDIAYHRTKHREEVERCAKRSAWVHALKTSL